MVDIRKRHRGWTAEERQEMARLYQADWSMQDIADRFACNRATVRYHLQRMAIPFRSRGTSTPRARAKISGAGHGMWKGGRSKNHGYVDLLMPDHPAANSYGYVPEHRLVVENHLREADPDHLALDGGYLRRDWVVHHRNGTKDDNRLENLEPLPRSVHHSWMHYQDEIRMLRALLRQHGIQVPQGHRH